MYPLLLRALSLHAIWYLILKANRGGEVVMTPDLEKGKRGLRNWEVSVTATPGLCS